MNPEGVRANFQEEEHFEEWMGGNLNDALLFRGMVFYFDKEESHGPRPDSKMIDFIVRRPDEVWLAGEPLVWWTRENSIARLKQRQIGFSTRYVTMENRRRNYLDYAHILDIESLSLSLFFTEGGEFLQLHASD